MWGRYLKGIILVGENHMEKVKKMYQKAYDKYGNSLDSILFPKGRQDLRFKSLCRCIDQSNRSTLLDYGCGLGHLYYFLNENFPKIRYFGADIVDEFILENKKNINDEQFFLIQSEKDIDCSFDYIVSAGVFNLLYVESKDEHKSIVYNILQSLFKKANIALSVNFMSDEVDFQQDGAFHININELLNFSKSNLTKRLIVDQSYMPYEFTMTLFKDANIISPENIYNEK